MSALHLAEQATLGTLMLDPGLPAQTAAWLRSEDFAHAWHAQVHTAIHELNAAHEPVSAHRVGLRLIDRLGRREADVPHLVDLLQAVPTRAAGREYAVLVVEGSLRRQVACTGVLLQAAALNAAATGQTATLDVVTGQIDATAVAAEQRWELATGRRAGSAGIQDRALRPVAVATGAHVAADRALAAHPLPTGEEGESREITLVAALINHPDQIPVVSSWLRAETLTSTTWRPVYEALVNLHEAARTIDEVTVSWELHRNSALHGPAPDPEVLREEVAHAGIIDVATAARAVAGDQLRLTADRAATALRVDAANPGLDLRDLLGTVGLLTAAVRAQAAHLHPTPRLVAPRPDTFAPVGRVADGEWVLSR